MSILNTILLRSSVTYDKIECGRYDFEGSSPKKFFDTYKQQLSFLIAAIIGAFGLFGYRGQNLTAYDQKVVERDFIACLSEVCIDGDIPQCISFPSGRIFSVKVIKDNLLNNTENQKLLLTHLVNKTCGE